MDEYMMFFRGVSSKQKRINMSVEKNPCRKGMSNAEHARYGISAAMTGVKKR